MGAVKPVRRKSSARFVAERLGSQSAPCAATSPSHARST